MFPVERSAQVKYRRNDDSSGAKFKRLIKNRLKNSFLNSDTEFKVDPLKDDYFFNSLFHLVSQDNALIAFLFCTQP